MPGLPGYDHWLTSNPDDDDEDFPDQTDPRDDFEPPEPPTPARYRSNGRTVFEEDYMYDPMARYGGDFE